MLHLRAGVPHIDIWRRVRPALISQQKRIALRVISRMPRLRLNSHQAPIRILPMPGRNSLAHDREQGNFGRAWAEYVSGPGENSAEGGAFAKLHAVRFASVGR